MKNSQSKRAIQARKWRDSARAKRRFNNIISEYVRYKHVEIYNECLSLYESLKKKYPDLAPKKDLTKTSMFRRIIESYSSDTEDDNECTTSEAVSAVPAVDECTTSEVVFTVPAVDECTTSEAVFTVPAVDECTTSEAVPAVDECTTSEAVPAVPAVDECTTSEAVSAVPAVDECTISEAVFTVPATDECTTSDAQHTPALIPVQHLYVNYNSLGEIVEELVDEGEYVNMRALQNELIDDIINDLEQDQNVQELLNDYHPPSMEEDEGIELNVESEIDELFDFGF